MSYDLVGGVGTFVKVHVDMANTSLEEELSVVPDDQLTSVREDDSLQIVIQPDDQSY
jgi:hypothetical protein